jgi:hypothetical protein
MSFYEVDFNNLKQNDKLIKKSLEIREKSNEVKQEISNIENILIGRKYKKNNFRKNIFFFILIIILPFSYLFNDNNFFYNKQNNTVSKDIIKYNKTSPLQKIKLISKKLIKPRNVIIGGLSLKVIQLSHFYKSHVQKLESIIRILINK